MATTGFSSWLSTYEDNDLCLQLTHFGKSLLLRNDTLIIHHHSSTGREGGRFYFYNSMWKYIFTMHINRVKIIFLHFPYRLPVLPLLDAIFCPFIFFYQLFFYEKRSNELFEEKSKASSGGFVTFVLFNLISMFLAWLYAYLLILQSLIFGRKSIIHNKK